RMTSVSASGDVFEGSNPIVACSVIRFTFALSTPGACSSARCTRALHAAHVMPVTLIVADEDEGATVIPIPEARLPPCIPRIQWRPSPGPRQPHGLEPAAQLDRSEPSGPQFLRWS